MNTDNYKEEFAKRLKNILKTKRMSGRQLADKSGISSSSITYYLNAKRECGKKNLTKISQALDVSESWLLGYETGEEENLDKLTFLNSNFEGYDKSTETEEVSNIINNDDNFFNIKIVDDNMAPTILKNDLIVLKKYDNVSNYEDQFVLISIGNQYTIFSKVFKEQDGWILKSGDADKNPLFYSNEDIENLPIKIVGIAIELVRKF